MRIRVTIVRTGVVKFDRCYSKPDCCDSKEVDFAAVARATAVAKRPDEMAIQRDDAASKTTRAPDYADAFTPLQKAGPPLCAHLTSFFGRGFHFANTVDGTEKITWHGRIAGVPGTRIYIRPANPEVCDGAVEPKCNGKAYLSPGDRAEP
jgi:hypothetical protein